MRNPLRKRVPRELLGDWHKYAVIMLFMVFMIAVVSAMYVGNDSMLKAAADGKTKYHVEDGRFELDQNADEEFLSALETGKKADLKAYLLDKAYEEAEKSATEAVDEAFAEQLKATVPEEYYETALEEAKKSDEYTKALDEAIQKAHTEAEKTVDEKYREAEKEYELNDADFTERTVSVVEHFYREESEDHDSDGKEDATIRIYKSDSDVDKACFLEGRAPKKSGEIALDRMHASNVGIEMGQTVTIGGESFKVVGLISYANYLTLHQKNTDLMFNAFEFDVGMVIPEDYDRLTSREHYNYAWFYEEEKPEGDMEKASYSSDFMKVLLTQTAVKEYEIKDYVPEYLNQAINFAPDDMKGDKTMGAILVYILIGVIAFIFAITISNTIEKEATVIGTLRASGYTKGELIRHYMTMPVIVTLIGGLIGNILGYTVFKDVVVYMYYNSYSLPAYVTVWSFEALLKTTLIPLILMLVINLCVIVKKLKLSPLRFLRRDLSKSRRTKARRLPKWSFMNRFRLRIIGQNLPNYLVLFIGIILIEVMLCFAIGFPESLNNYSRKAPDMLFAKYQYMLMGMEDKDGNPLETSVKGAEKFSCTSLLKKNENHDESITVYGVSKDSAYINIDDAIGEEEVFLSSAFAEKYGLKKGDSLKLAEKYENQSYEFKVAGIFEYDGGVAVFMPNRNFNSIFNHEENSYNGFFSNEKITDIDEKYIANVMTKKDITKVTDQLQHSMGGFMSMFEYVLFILAIILIYLLSKIIIEKNENQISMSKILGFRNGEIGSLYIMSTTWLVVIFTLLGSVIGYGLISEVFVIFMQSMDGWFTFYISTSGFVKMILFILAGYGIVTIADFIRIRRIPMDEALKNVD